MIPKSASKPRLPSSVAATAARDAASGNAETYVVADDAISAPKMTPHRTPPRAARFAVVTNTVRAGRRSSRCIGGLRHIGSVVREEELFERRLAAREMSDAASGQDREERVYRPVDLARDAVAVDRDAADAGHRGEIRRLAVELHLNGERGQMPHVGDPPDVHQSPGAQDRDPVA